MSSLSHDGLEHKTRVEHDFWRPALDRSLDAWMLAPNEEKSALLLNGQILNWAESWLLTHPSDVSPNQRNFILRSLAAEQRKTANQRDQLVRTQTRKESRYLWVIMVCAFVALIPTLNDFKKDVKQELKRELMTRVLDGQQPSSIKVVLRAIVRKIRDGNTEDPELAAMQRRRRIAQEQEAAALTDPDAEGRSAGEVNMAYDTDRGPPDLARIARRLSQEGDNRRAAQLALEYFADTTKPPNTPTEKRRRIDAMTGATAAVSSQIQVIASEQWSPHASALSFCAGASRIAGTTDDGGLAVWDRIQAAVVGRVSAKSGRLDIMAIDADCRRVVVLNLDGDADLMAIDTGKPIARLGGHPNAIVSAAFSPDGQRVITLSRDSIAKIWHGETGRPVSTLHSDDDALIGATFSPDGTEIATWSSGKSVDIWDSTTGRSKQRLAGHYGAVTSAVFDPKGETLATTSTDGLLRLWDRAQRRLRATVRSNNGALTIARFTRDGRRIAMLAGDAQVQIFDTRSGLPIVALSEPETSTRAFAFSPDGTLAAATNWSGNATLWRIEGGERLTEFAPVGETLTGISFSDDGKQLLAFTAEGALVQWPVLPTPEAVAEHVGRVASACLTEDERRSLRMKADRPAWCRPQGDMAPVPTPQ
jgi:WD40 repeat protein